MSVHSPTPLSREAPQLARFLEVLETEGVSQRQREAHRCAVERLGEFMSPRGAEEATPQVVRAFLSYLGELGVSHQSQGVYRAVLTKWMDHLATVVVPSGHAVATPRAGEPVVVAPIPHVVDPAPAAEAVDFDRTWPLWSGGPQPPIDASASAMPPAPVDVPPSPGAPDFGVAFDAAAVAARAAQTITASSWDEVEALSEPVSVPVEAEAPPLHAGFEFAAEPPSAAGPERFGFEPPAGADAAPPPASPTQLPKSSASETWSSEQVAAGEAVADPRPSAAGFGQGDGMVERSPAPVEASSAGSAPGFIKAPPMRSVAAAEAPVFDAGFTPEARTTAPGVKGIALASSSPEVEEVTSLGGDDSWAGGHERPPVPVVEEGLQGWGVRQGRVERKDLSLSEIRNMAMSGAITARTMVRRPGGDWMQAGEFFPLRSALIAAAEAARSGTVSRRRGDEQPAPVSRGMRTLLAWLGALGGAALASLGWWLGAVVAGRELAPLAALGGLLGGFAASWLSRSEGKVAGIPGAAAGLMTVVLGRYLVFATLSTGAIAFEGAHGPPGFIAFVSQGLTLTLGLSLLASTLLGYLMGSLDAGRAR